MALSNGTVRPILADKLSCTGCLACVNCCHTGALTPYLEEDGHIYVGVNEDQCVGCLLCQRVCEEARQCFGSNDLKQSIVYAAWAEDRNLRAHATSGGAFGAFADAVLDRGGCVIGAELNGFECKHTAIYEREDIFRIQKSKYMASSMEDVYRVISEELKKRDVLFAGLGCQCAGVISFFKDFSSEYNLYTVDIVCGGSPSRLLIDLFKEEHPEIKGLTSFRAKERYELGVYSDKGRIAFTQKNLPLHGFNCGMANRYSCYQCPFAKAHRKTDTTIGDLWNDKVFPEEHREGISMVIVHSEKGRKLCEMSALHYEPVAWESVLLFNPRIVCGKQHLFFPRRRLVKNAGSMKRETFRRLYTMDLSWKNPLLFLFRIYRYVVQRMEKKQNRKRIQKIMQHDL